MEKVDIPIEELQSGLADDPAATKTFGGCSFRYDIRLELRTAANGEYESAGG